MTEKAKGQILVATDDSAPARAAALMGIRLAASEGLTVRGLYVVDEALALDTYADPRSELGENHELLSRSEVIRRLEAQGERALGWLVQQCREAGVPERAEVLAGGVPELLAREAAGARLLAIGRRGHGHAGSAGHLGSTFHAVVRRVEVPVLIGGDEERPLRRLLVAYDGSTAAQGGLDWAARLQGRLSLQLSIVAVDEDGRDGAGALLEQARDRLGRDRQAQFLTASGSPAEAIVATAQEQQSDLIVMGGHHRGAVLESLLGSTVDQVLRSSEVAVLML